MSEVLTEIDDPVTATLMEGVNEARILLASEAHRKDLAEIAAATNEMLRLDARRVDLQKAIGERNAVYLKAEAALGAHLRGKMSTPAVPASFGVEEPREDPAPSRSTRRVVAEDHASNCAVYFNEPCDCQ